MNATIKTWVIGAWILISVALLLAMRFRDAAIALLIVLILGLPSW